MVFALGLLCIIQTHLRLQTICKIVLNFHSINREMRLNLCKVLSSLCFPYIRFRLPSKMFLFNVNTKTQGHGHLSIKFLCILIRLTSKVYLSNAQKIIGSNTGFRYHMETKMKS